MPFSFFRKPVAPTTYAEGQEWGYKTRPGEERSTVIINKVEPHDKLGNIYHVSVTNVRVKKLGSDTVVQTELPHFPVSTTTLEQSLTSFIRLTKLNPEYIAGYNEWKTAFDQGQAGIFTISVAEIVDLVETAISKSDAGDAEA